MKIVFLFFVIIFAVLSVLYLFFPDLFLHLTLDNIKGSHDRFVLLYEENPVKTVSLFVLFNILMASLPVPGISMISFFGGSLFGFWPGFFYSSLATAIGNLFGFLISRYFLQEWVRERYGKELVLFRNEWQRDGALALFSFRLFPFIPSFVANLVMGVSALYWWTFFWVSWVGRIPMVLVYTWSGVQVAKIESLEDILSVKLIASFILLGVLPWILKFVLKKMKQNN